MSILKTLAKGLADRAQRRGPAEDTPRVDPLDVRYCRHDDAVAEAAGEELLLVQLARGSTFRLNRTGRAIYERAIAGETARTIATALAPELGASTERIAADALALLGELEESALIVRRTEGLEDHEASK